jgi:hypothetical protein
MQAQVREPGGITDELLLSCFGFLVADGSFSEFPCSARLADYVKVALSTKAVKRRLGRSLILQKIRAGTHFQERT